VAHRPTGSIFKPFVYATAFQTAVEGTMLPGQNRLFSPVTMLSDEQQTYGEGTQNEYTPRNYKGEYYGDITARYALLRSDNNATISLAGMVGFDRVAALARNAGVKNAEGTPSIAIGSYDATPLDMAGAYTIFSNGGVHIDPWMLASVRAPNGDIIEDYTPTTRQVIDPRVAFLTTYMMEAVLQGNGSDPCVIDGRDYCGTGAGVRNLGFISPAAGKTGTSHDAWFAGRLHEHRSRGRARRSAHLGRIHEAGCPVAAVFRHQRIYAAPGSADHPHRQEHQPAGRRHLHRRLLRGFSRRHRAHRNLRPQRRHGR
jgi:penicillin-binding protein 1B